VTSRRTLRNLDRLRAGTRLLAGGSYAARVDPPPEPELADLADDINTLAATLAATEQRRAALIGDVAHELRTPLTTINGYLEGFDDRLVSADELVTTVRVQVRRLDHLAGDLAAISRAEEGRLDLDLHSGDLREILTSVTDGFRPQFQKAGVDIHVDAPAAVQAVVDRERMVQVLTNLLRNALAYTPAGGRVDARLTPESGGARITVSDTGRGLLADDLERIFERFYRADPHDHSGGTGIGLTISRAIMRAHGGDLIARSPGRGQGSTFEIFLPIG
jgi:histidine kinase